MATRALPDFIEVEFTCQKVEVTNEDSGGEEVTVKAKNVWAPELVKRPVLEAQSTVDLRRIMGDITNILFLRHGHGGGE